jgi:flagellar biosynthesis regulator FlbT
MTKTALEESFSSSNMHTGFGGRFLYFYDDTEAVLNERFLFQDKKNIPKSISEQILHLYNSKKANSTKEPVELVIDDDVRKTLNLIRKSYFIEAKNLEDNNMLLPIVNRAFETIIRIAVLYTVSNTSSTGSLVELAFLLLYK